MKRIALFAILLVAGLSLAAGSFAAGTSLENKYHPDRSVTSQTPGHDIISANRFIGTDVQNRQGEFIGEIQDLMIDRQTGQVGYVILSEGLGLGAVAQDRHAVPFRLFRQGAESDTLVLTVDENKLANAPKRRAGMSDREYSLKLHQHYGQAPYWEESVAPGQSKEKQAPVEKRMQDKPGQKKY